jgi:hypothetical protein
MINNIQLTEEHKTKLLEMCKKLFPEYPWGFGQFYSSEVGGIYTGLDYLDITHLNHKIPCIVSRYELEHAEIDTSNLRVIEKHELYKEYDKLEYGFINNFESLKGGFTIEHKTDENGNYDYTKPIIKQHTSYSEVYVEGIHWFEFVFLHLIGRLQEALPDTLVWRDQPPYVGNVFNWKEGNKWTLYTEFMFAYPKACWGGSVYPNNPIDYLYEQFLKLK